MIIVIAFIVTIIIIIIIIIIVIIIIIIINKIITLFTSQLSESDITFDIVIGSFLAIIIL